MKEMLENGKIKSVAKVLAKLKQLGSTAQWKPAEAYPPFAGVTQSTELLLPHTYLDDLNPESDDTFYPRVCSITTSPQTREIMSQRYPDLPLTQETQVSVQLGTVGTVHDMVDKEPSLQHLNLQGLDPDRPLSDLYQLKIENPGGECATRTI